MTPDQLLTTVSTVLLQAPPRGLSKAYINGFLTRNRAGLLKMIQKQFDKMCRLDALIPTYERKVGYRFQPPEPSTQVAVFVQDVGSAVITLLSIKARCHPANPVKLRQFAVHSKRADERTWRIHPGEDWHPSEDDALTAFAHAHAHEARWLVNGKDGDWMGVREAPYVLTEARAIQVAQARQWELSDEKDRAERAQTRLQRDYERERIAREDRRQQPEKAPETENVAVSHTTSPVAVSPAEAPKPSESTPTLWGGLRGAQLPDESVTKGMRVVTSRLEHGVVEKVEVSVWTIGGLTGWGAQTTEKRQEKSYFFHVRLDSGRLDHQSHLFAELAPPREVVPDVDLLHQTGLLSPEQAWREVRTRFGAIAFNDKKAQDARKPQVKAQYAEEAKRARARFESVFRRFYDWRTRYERVVIEDFDPLQYRTLTLAAGIREDGWEAEERWLKGAPQDWRTRFKVGEAVIRPSFEPGGHTVEHRDRIESIQGFDAIMASGGARIPLYLLRSAPDAVVEVPSYDKPRYLVQLGEDMLVPTQGTWGASPASAERGAVARAVKSYLADRGIQVRTRVQNGANMNGVDLYPPGERWTPGQIDQLNELLPGLGARWDNATFHPSAKEGTPGDPYTDYYGRPSGILFEPAQIADFAPYLARALRDAGQALNRQGEAWLVKAQGSQSQPSTAETEGCIDTSFHMPAYGTIRVVCGAKGRRDSWNNVHLGSARYGHDGRRWAKGNAPPAAVLEELRKRGITAFGAEERLSEPGEDSSLDWVVAEVVENGGLHAALITDIASELRPKARAIPGFLTPDGLSWMELARLHYANDGVVVVEDLPSDWFSADVSYETTGGFRELVHFGLEYSFPDVQDEHYEAGELVERLCGCQRPSSPSPRNVA